MSKKVQPCHLALFGADYCDRKLLLFRDHFYESMAV